MKRDGHLQKRVLRDAVDHVDARYVILLEVAATGRRISVKEGKAHSGRLYAQLLEQWERAAGGLQCTVLERVDLEKAETLCRLLDEVAEGQALGVAIAQPETAQLREGRVRPVVVDHGVEKLLKPREGLIAFNNPSAFDTELLDVDAGLAEKGRQVAKEHLALLFERRDVALVPRHFRATLEAGQVWAELDDLFDIEGLAFCAEVEPFNLAGEGQEARQRVDAKVVQDERREAWSLAQCFGDGWRDGMLCEPRNVLELRHFLRGSEVS